MIGQVFEVALQLTTTNGGRSDEDEMGEPVRLNRGNPCRGAYDSDIRTEVVDTVRNDRGRI